VIRVPALCQISREVVDNLGGSPGEDLLVLFTFRNGGNLSAMARLQATVFSASYALRSNSRTQGHRKGELAAVSSWSSRGRHACNESTTKAGRVVTGSNIPRARLSRRRDEQVPSACSGPRLGPSGPGAERAAAVIDPETIAFAHEDGQVGGVGAVGTNV